MAVAACEGGSVMVGLLARLFLSVGLVVMTAQPCAARGGPGPDPSDPGGVRRDPRQPGPIGSDDVGGVRRSPTPSFAPPLQRFREERREDASRYLLRLPRLGVAPQVSARARPSVIEPPTPTYYFDGGYYRYWDDNWFVAERVDGRWTAARMEDVPATILAIPKAYKKMQKSEARVGPHPWAK